MDIITLIDRAVATFGDAPAIRTSSTTISYREFGDSTNRLANGLLALGLRKGDPVGVLLPNGPELILTYYALAKAGLVRVGLNYRDTDADHRFKLADSGARALITATGQPDAVDHMIGVEQLRELLATGDPAPCAVRSEPDDLYRIGYTGGTTGRPKGVRLTHGIELALIRNYLIDLLPGVGPHDTMLHAAPMTHASGSFFLPHFLKGACNVVLEKFEPGAFLTLLRDSKATCTFLVPTMISMIVDHPEATAGMAPDLRRLCYGASPIAPSVAAKATALFGHVLAQTYGQSEAPMSITLLKPDEHDRVGSAGRPYTLVEVEVHDKDGRTVPTGDEGEVVVRGDIVTPGYLNRPDATAETLRGGWLHTGDLGRFDAEGYLYLLDRMGDMIISGGYNVYPREVEDVLMAHPAVSECAVVGMADDRWGEVVQAVVAVLEPVAEAELMAFAKERLAGYKQPKAIFIRPTLPKSPAGKILRREVRADLVRH